ncbi:MAG: hypothetical protein EHM45_23355, partial [Desulfobacteraceae bacterium]
MISDIRLSLGYFDHPKIVELALLGGDSAVLSHIRLIVFCGKYRPKGVFSGLDEVAVMRAAGTTDANFMPLALRLALIDKMPDGTLEMHDWEQWQPWSFYSEERSKCARESAKKRWKHLKKYG